MLSRAYKINDGRRGKPAAALSGVSVPSSTVCFPTKPTATTAVYPGLPRHLTVSNCNLHHMHLAACFLQDRFVVLQSFRRLTLRPL
jgi:hypothetical protein